MRNRRKFVLSFYLILLAMLVTASLVLRFAAPSPTHRWYSTEVLDVRTTSTEQGINNILFVVIIFTSAVLVLGYIINNRPKSPGDVSDDVDRAEDSVEETEEFMKRMERLSKRSKDDDKKGKL